MRKPKKTDETLAHINPKAIVAQGLEEAFIGYARRANRPSVALYDYYTCIQVLMRDEDFSRDDSVKFMEEFILEHDAGESSPAFALWKDEYENNGED
jgi:hypothetical protein